MDFKAKCAHLFEDARWILTLVAIAVAISWLSGGDAQVAGMVAIGIRG